MTDQLTCDTKKLSSPWPLMKALILLASWEQKGCDIAPDHFETTSAVPLG